MLILVVCLYYSCGTAITFIYLGVRAAKWQNKSRKTDSIHLSVGYILLYFNKVGVAGARAIKSGSRVTLSIKIARTCASLTHEGNESSRDSWPFLWWTGQNRKVGSAYLHGPCTNEYHCSKEKAGSLHSEQPRGTDCFCSARSQQGRAWKGALFAQGEAWMPWLGCRGWHVVLLEPGWRGMLHF